MTRRAFTLLEVMVALVVTGLVVTLAYSTAHAGLDTGDRLSAFREGEGRSQVVHTLLNDALRHAVIGVRGGAPVFDLVNRMGSDGAPADSLRFESRGIVSPLGTSEVWSIAAWRDDNGVHVEGSPLGAGGESIVRMVLAAATSFDVRGLGRGTDAEWRDEWSEASVTPDAVWYEIGDRATSSAAREAGVRTTVRIGLERQP